MSELGCPNLSEPEMIQKFGQLEPDPGLNSDMTDRPNFKFGQKFYDRTRFFRIGQIRVIGSDRFLPALNILS